MTVLLAAALLLQEAIAKSDPHRGDYHGAALACQEGLKLLDAKPAEAIPKFERALEVFRKLSEKKAEPERYLERRLRIYDTFGDSQVFDFFPHQYLGRARMRLAEAASTDEERREQAEAAVRDLEAAVKHNRAASESYLKAAREALEKLPKPPAPPDPEELRRRWKEEWTQAARALSLDTWKEKDAGLGARLRELLGRMAREAAPPEALEAGDWVRAEAERARGKKPVKDEAARRVAWCRTLEAALRDFKEFAGPLQALAEARQEAERIASYKGAFTLKIAVRPWARVELEREGRPVALEDGASTPLVRPNLEVGAFRVKLSHPVHGTRTFDIRESDVREGKTYLLHGSVAWGEFRLTELKP